MTKLKIAFGVALLCTTLEISADQISGRELLAFCDGSAGAEGKRYCDGYLSAAIETQAVWALWGRMERVFCFPKGDKSGYAFDAVVNYLRARPNELDYEASSLVLTAVNNAYPCD